MEKTIFMGQMDIAKAPEVLRTTLGSCVGVILIDPDFNCFGLAHIMLPDSRGEGKSNPAKYADTAIPALLEKMQVTGSRISKIRAKLSGGANMFSKVVTTPVMAIGEQNIKAVKEILKNKNITIIAEDLGGDKGRHVLVKPAEHKVWVTYIGENPKEL